MKTLTPKQAEVLRFLEEKIAAGQPPTYREIGKHFGYTQHNAMLHVRALERKGLLRITDGQSRGISLANGHQPFHVKEGLPPRRIDKHPWISIRDSLPGVGKTVLVVTKASPQLKRAIALGCMQARGFIVNGEVNHDVTHWMPLPEMPAEDGETVQ